MLIELGLLVGSLLLAAILYAVLHRQLGWVEFSRPFVGPTLRPFADLLPLEDIQNGFYILSDGSLVAGWEVQGINPEMRAPEDVAREIGRLNHAWNALNPGTEAIWQTRRTKDVTGLLMRFDEVSQPTTPERLFLKRSWRRQLHEMARSADFPFLDTRHYVFLRVSPQKEGPAPARVLRDLLKRASRPGFDAEAEADDVIRQYQRRVLFFQEQTRAYIQMLGGTSFRPRPMANSELDQYAKSLIWSFETMSTSFTISRRPDPNRFLLQDADTATRRVLLKDDGIAEYFPQTIRAQIASVDFNAYPDHLQVDGRLIGVMRMFMAPASVLETMLVHFRDFMQFPSTYTVRITPRAKQAELDRMRKDIERKTVTSTTKQLGSATLDTANLKNLEEAQERYEDALRPDRNPFGVEVTITYEANDLTELKKRGDQIQNYFLQLADCRMLPERHGADRVFLESLPFAVTSGKSARMVLFTDEVSCLVPAFKPWSGSDEPVRVFRTRAGEPFAWDPVDKTLNTMHQVHMAMTGAGKGFIGQSMTYAPTIIKGTADVLILDSMGTYRRLCEVLGGIYYEASAASEQALNCLAIPPSYYVLDAKDQQEFLRAHTGTVVSFVLALANPEAAQERVWQTIVSEVVNDLLRTSVEERQEVLLRHVYSALTQYRNVDYAQREDDARQLAAQLKQYIHDPITGATGQYASLFDRPQSFSADTDLLTVDFNRIASENDVVLTAYLVAVVAGVFVQRMMRNWTSGEGRYTRWLGDEAAKYLRNAKFGQQFMRGLREGRKARTGVDLMLQSRNDLSLEENRSFGIPALEAATTRIYLKHQRNASATAAFESDGLRELAERVFGLETKIGYYSEAVIQQEGGRFAHVVIVPDPFELWLYTTNPADTDVEKNYVKRYGPGTSWNLSPFELTYLLAMLWPNGAIHPATVTGIAADRYPPDALVRRIVDAAREELEDCRRELERKGIEPRTVTMRRATGVVPVVRNDPAPVPSGSGGPPPVERRRRARSLAELRSGAS